MFELSEITELVIKMSAGLNFYTGDISSKVRNSAQRGLGISPEDRSCLLGFILFSYEAISEETKSVRLHIEYLLVAQGRRGVGLSLVNFAIQKCQSDFPNFCVIAFAEAKTNGIAPNFWLKKLNFELEEGFIEDVYFPAYKIYPKTNFL